MQKQFILCIAIMAFVASAIGQTQNDTVKAYVTQTPVVIDGKADDACWQTATWHAIDQVMIPWNATMETGDFEGRFKVAWDASFLYILVEVTDDVISDDHSNPTTNWWDDDCCEVFIDEDRSMGGHECNNNAFAYHVSLFYDAIDLSPSCGGINYKEHVQVIMDTLGDNNYIWEMAFKLHDDSYNNSNPEASRVTLSANKLMGFAIAYCDNDETNARENFIGSQKLTSATANDLYKNASLFGPMVLIDPDHVGLQETVHELFKLKTDGETITVSFENSTSNKIVISSISGRNVKTIMAHNNTNTINISDLAQGVYIISVTNAFGTNSQRFIKQ